DLRVSGREAQMEPHNLAHFESVASLIILLGPCVLHTVSRARHLIKRARFGLRTATLVHLKAYKKSTTIAGRWNAWVTFVISPAELSTASSPPPMVTKAPPHY